MICDHHIVSLTLGMKDAECRCLICYAKFKMCNILFNIRYKYDSLCNYWIKKEETDREKVLLT